MSMITIRQVSVEDAAEFLRLRQQIDQETKFMMLEPGERAATLEQERERLKNMLAADNQMTFLAEDGGQIVGFLWANGGAYRRNHHNIHIVIGILQACTNQGIGTRLFQACETWARQQGIHRMELTVMPHNHLGMTLYKKMGFEIEGTAKHAMKVDGEYVDLYYMSKLLSPRS